MTSLYAYVATLALTTNDSYRSNGSTKFCSMHTFNFGTDRFPHDEYCLCCCSYRGDNCVICVVDVSTFVLDLRTAVLCCCAGTVFVLVGCWMGNRIRLCVFLILFTKTHFYDMMESFNKQQPTTLQFCCCYHDEEFGTL